MRSKTSFFNKTMFAKSMARFWPLWGAYLAVWLLAMPVRMLSNGQPYYLKNLYVGQRLVLQLAIYGGVIGGLVMALLAAMAVWSFLYNARSAHGMACLPVRREGQYCSALLAGFVPVLCANALIFVLTLLAEAALGAVYPGALLTWLAVVTLAYLFFYAFATFCAQLTGNIIILPLVYAVLNFTVYAVREIVVAILSRFVYGMSHVSGNLGFLDYLSPPIGYLRGGQYGSGILGYAPVYADMADGSRDTVGWAFHGWGVVLGYAVAGLILIFLGLLLFRKRRMETAGDVVAVNALKPVFRWCMALGCGLVFGMLMYGILFSFSDRDKNTAFLTLLIFMLVGAFIGWFASEMLMKKSFRVFHRNSWAGLGLCGIVIVALMLSMRLDLFGYEKHVPRADRVEFVSLSVNGEIALLNEPENVSRAVALHGDIVAHKAQHENRWTVYGYYGGYSCHITYNLQNGGFLTRRYELTDAGEGHDDLENLQDLLNVPEAVQNRKAQGASWDADGNRAPSYFDYTRDNISYAGVSVAMTGDECAKAGNWASAEEYVLGELAGWGPEELTAMTPQERKEALNEVILANAVNGGALYEKYVNSYSYTDTATLDLDPSEAYFIYELYLTPAEAAELYQTCCLPDIADGTLGRVSILDDGWYENEFYNARIHIEAREPDDDGTNAGYPVAEPTPTANGRYRYVRFSTMPTVDSVRTNAWLREHGLTLHTNGETTAFQK